MISGIGNGIGIDKILSIPISTRQWSYKENSARTRSFRYEASTYVRLDCMLYLPLYPVLTKEEKREKQGEKGSFAVICSTEEK